MPPDYECNWSEAEKERWRKQGEVVSAMSAMVLRKWRAEEGKQPVGWKLKENW